AGIHEPRSRGSSTSRSASPSMLKPNTTTEIATPGQMAIQGALYMYVRPEPDSIEPHDGCGGGTPYPRNDSADSARITPPSPMVAATVLPSRTVKKPTVTDTRAP